MVRMTAAALAATLGVLALPGAALAQSPAPGLVDRLAADAQQLDPAAPRELIVRYEPGATVRQRGLARDRVNADLVRPLRLSRTQLVAIEEGADAEAAAARLARQPGVAWAVPNRTVGIRAVAPNDPRFGELWGLRNGTTPGADVNALAAWDRTRGAGQVVAVVDTGIDLAHPDIAPNLWTNPGEIAGNGIDDDGNGFVDDVHGWDFVAPDADGKPVGDADPDDYHAHGTHVAGTIAAVADNGIGVAGVAPEARVMAVRVLDATGSGPYSAIFDGIDYAARAGADVINLSLGGSIDDDDTLRAWTAVIDAAGAQGAVVVAAAGNSAANVDVVGDVPCSVSSPALVCVAALKSTGELDTSYSNYGATTIDVGAPGSGVLSSVPPMLTAFSDDLATDAFWQQSSGGTWGLETIGNRRYLSDSPGVDYAFRASSGAWTSDPIAPPEAYGCVLTFGLRAAIAPGDLGAVAVTDAFGLELYAVHLLSGSTTNGTIVEALSFEAFPGVSPYVQAIVSDEREDGIQDDGILLTALNTTCRTDARSGPGIADEYAFFNGTSMATPHVAGVAALVRAVAPWATPAEVAAAIRAGTVPIPSLAGKTTTGGRVDAVKAIEAAPAKPVDPTPPPTPPADAAPTTPAAPAQPVAPVPQATAPIPTPEPPATGLPAQTGPVSRAACAGLRGKALASCKLSQRIEKACGRLRGARKKTCAKRVRAIVRCEALPSRGKAAKAKKARCLKTARAIGKPKAKAKKTR